MLQITDIFSARAVALNRTENPSNREAFVGPVFFPNKKKNGRSVKWLKTHKGLNAILMPSSLDAIPMIRTREGFVEEEQTMLFFRESMQVKEEDMMKIQDVQDSNSPYVQEILESIYDDTNKLLDAAEIAAEVMRMQLLATQEGKPIITIGTGKGSSDNIIRTINYDPDGTYASKHYMKVTGNTWDKADQAKPLNDIQEATTYLKSIGVIPRFALMNSVTLNYLVASEQIKNAVITSSGRTVDFMDETSAISAFERMTGLRVVRYDKMYVDFDGAEKKFYPDNKVTIIGSNILGNTYYGVTPEERTLLGNPNVDVSMYDGRIAVAVKTEAGPPVSVLTSVSQMVIPSYEGLDSTYVIDVKGE